MESEPRERPKSETPDESAAQLALLQHKLERLARELEKTQSERDDARAQADELAHNSTVPLTSVVRTAQRSPDDSNKDLRLALMRQLVEENREIRGDSKSA